MPGFNPDKINIHDLTVEEPESQAELPFDPERDITKSDWAEIEDRLGEAKTKKHCYALIDYALAELQFKGKKVLDASDFESINAFMDQKRTEGFYDTVIWLASQELILGEKPSLRSNDLSFADSQINHLRKDKEWLAFLSMSAHRKILLGEKQDQNFDLEEKEKSDITARLDHYKKSNRWYEIASVLASLKIVGCSVENLQNYLDGMRDFLRARKKNVNFEKFASFAVNLNIITADEVRIPEEGGLELIHRKKSDLETQTPEMPEQRNF